jgi:hypothetical protein
MSERTRALREQLIRNIDELPKERELRAPLYDTLCGPPRRRHGGACARHQHRHRRAGHARLPVPPAPCAGGGVRRPRRARCAARRRRDARAEGGRRRLPAGRTGLPAPDRQHLRTRRSSTCRSARRRGPRSSNTPTRGSTSRRPGRAARPASRACRASTRISTTGSASLERSAALGE